MARVLRMPGVSANATEAVLAEWLVAESAEFAAADALATVETDKALVDVEAEAAGVVLKALVAAGSQVEVGAPIAVLGAVGERVDDLAALLRELGVAEDSAPVIAERRDVPDQPVERTEPDVDPGSGAPVVKPAPESPVADSPAPAAENAPPPARRPGRVFASPLARKIARDAGLAIEEIPGTGPRQRVLRRDVDALLASRRAVSPPAPPATPTAAPTPTETAIQPSSGAGFEDVPHTRLRRAVAERLATSKREAPHFYVRTTVRVERLLALRAELNEALDGEVKVSVNDLVVKAVALAHERVPDLNVTWTDDAVRRWHTADIAVAVATDRGLVTPVLRDVGHRSVSSVATAVRELAGRAREGRLRQEELEGGSITVTNLGMYGVEEFAAIINPPHAAILAVGAVREEPVVQDGSVVPGSVMSLTLSVDHRPVDGVVAARWLAELTGLLERPVRLLA
ncbi:dehydrogenase [Nocardioides sp. Soil777]|uniref:2-oxo acid dehydrogenase subunit E2 n=1 Tax=Nocardioides sp. Soil777 TaxID=1736409 RepID=UPI000702544C|nr:2-oxo acid dehydrogenase subunit E2 [Nocardioides sp. Soil777]KRF05886.1 dehydrogenase [Nocardioides sp. Soil777]